MSKQITLMLKKWSLSFFLLAGMLALTASDARAQDETYKIRVKVNGLADSTVYLANYYGEKLYFNDTTKADANGYFEFDGKPYEKGGKYAVVLPGPEFFDIIVTEEEIELETQVDDLVGGLNVIRSKENTQFVDYLRFIQEMRSKRAPYDAVMADSTAKEKAREAARRELSVLNEAVVDYQQRIINDHPDMLFSKLLKMTLDVQVPEPPAGIEDERLWKYYTYRDMYWDNVDLSDPRLVRDQMFHRVLDKYWSKVLPQVPDTLLKEGKALIDRMDNYDMFKYTTHHITYAAEKSNVMCMDKVFYGLVQEYYVTGRVDWLTEEQMDKIIERANEMRYSLCGERVPNVILPDTSGTNWVSLYDIDSKYTLLAIWESTCGHCKKEMPKLVKLYRDWKPKGLEVYSIGNDFETEPWLKFIRKKNIGDWINVSDNPAINDADSARTLIMNGTTNLLSLNFRSTFDVFSTPKMFLLDEDMKIIAKQLNAEQIRELLERLESQEMKEEEQ